MIRHDYAHPLRIDAGAGQVARASYADHVDQLLRQLLLTDPGERVCQPEFGCGLRRLVFAGLSDALGAALQIHVRQAIDRWLADQVTLLNVAVVTAAEAGSGLDEGTLLIDISYTLVDTMTPAQLRLKVI